MVNFDLLSYELRHETLLLIMVQTMPDFVHVLNIILIENLYLSRHLMQLTMTIISLGYYFAKRAVDILW